MAIHLRAWQEAALNKAIDFLVTRARDRHFLINAAPGAGKTIAACAIAQALLELREIDRVLVIAPRAEIVSQWAGDFKQVTGRYMSKVTGRDSDIEGLSVDLCATWAAVQGLLDTFQAVCSTQRTLVICDEHHHAAVEAAWGESANSAFLNAKYVLVLTGTPIRSDGTSSIWLAYDDAGAISHPEEGTYTLTYGEAVDLAYCRPITFHRHEGLFTVDLDGGEHVQVSNAGPSGDSDALQRIPALQRVLNFYRLTCTPQFEPDGKTPLVSGFQGSMLEYASQKLTELR